MYAGLEAVSDKEACTSTNKNDKPVSLQRYRKPPVKLRYDKVLISDSDSDSDSDRRIVIILLKSWQGH